MAKYEIIFAAILFFIRKGDFRVCYLQTAQFTTFDNLTMPNLMLQYPSYPATYIPLVFSLYDPSRLNAIMQMQGYPSSVWLDDFSIFAVNAINGSETGVTENIFGTYELHFCYGSCTTLSNISFGWTSTMVDNVITYSNPYYFPVGSDSTSYYFKLENLDYTGSLYPPDYSIIDPNYGRRRLTFFNKLLVLDVFDRTLSFDDTYSLLFASNTVGMCGLVTQDAPDTADDLVLPQQGGIYMWPATSSQSFFYYNGAKYSYYMQQDGQCNIGPLSQGYNHKKCQYKPVCEFNRPHHIRTFDDKHTWIDKTIQDSLLLVMPCDATVNPMPACFQGLVYNFAISTTAWMRSSDIFQNGNSDIEQLTYSFSFCAASSSNPNSCEQIEIDFGWKAQVYNGTTLTFPWTLNIQGSTLLTITSYSSAQDTYIQNSNDAMNKWNMKVLTFCDGTVFTLSTKNTFKPSAEMVTLLKNNNCGLCGDFNGDAPNVLEGFRSSQGGTTYANDMWSLSDITPFILQPTDGYCISGTCGSKKVLDNVRFLVLDEADRIHDLGFEQNMRKFVAHPGMLEIGGRQKLILSATFPDPIQKLAHDFLNQEHLDFIQIGEIGSANPKLDSTL